MPSLKDKYNSISDLFDTTYYFRKLGQYVFQGYVPSAALRGFIGTEFVKYIQYHEYIGHNNNLARRKTAGLPKIIGEYIVKNIYSENPEFSIDNSNAYEEIDLVLEDNDFINKSKDITESLIHMGGSFASAYMSDAKIKLNYIDGINGFITDYKDGKPNEAIFYRIKKRSEKTILGPKEYYYTLIDWHYEEDGVRYIQTEMYRDTVRGGFSQLATQMTPMVYGKHISTELVQFNIDVPTFVYFKTPIKNNKDLNSKEGLGALINSLDTHMAIDEVYDAMSNEIVNGRMQLGIPDSNTTTLSDGNGGFTKIYNPTNPHQFVFSDPAEKHLPTVYAPQLRIDSMISDMNMNIDMASVGVGVKPGTFRFDGKSIQTATQVITEKEDTAQTIKSYEQSLGKSIKQLFVLIKDMSNAEPALPNISEFEEKDISILWKDNVAIDDETEQQKDLEKIDRGMLTNWEFLMKWEGLTEEEAKARIARADEERSSSVELEFDNPNDTDFDVTVEDE